MVWAGALFEMRALPKQREAEVIGLAMHSEGRAFGPRKAQNAGGLRGGVGEKYRFRTHRRLNQWIARVTGAADTPLETSASETVSPVTPAGITAST